MYTFRTVFLDMFLRFQLKINKVLTDFINIPSAIIFNYMIQTFFKLCIHEQVID